MDYTSTINYSYEYAKLAEKLNYHSIWLTQHHSLLSLLISQPAMKTLHILAKTSKLKVGIAGNFHVGFLEIVKEIRHISSNRFNIIGQQDKKIATNYSIKQKTIVSKLLFFLIFLRLIFLV
ncbi:PUTATIVE OXYGENASE [Mesomycoplasma conjunctivae]|uniref:PUTATIVE OXYGENASE n=1 Tax=Mesomycoplasma conjunctivae (strain ATCC 25834 / NCTC 10147 / HRC/581) TaxID=572263 RepID=C5J6V0_MESCH|nr:PUTATIVE OXYGENASE [Mesomycoplasma conjunctivae]